MSKYLKIAVITLVLVAGSFVIRYCYDCHWGARVIEIPVTIHYPADYDPDSIGEK